MGADPTGPQNRTLQARNHGHIAAQALAAAEALRSPAIQERLAAKGVTTGGDSRKGFAAFVTVK